MAELKPLETVSEADLAALLVKASVRVQGK